MFPTVKSESWCFIFYTGQTLKTMQTVVLFYVQKDLPKFSYSWKHHLWGKDCVLSCSILRSEACVWQPGPLECNLGCAGIQVICWQRLSLAVTVV